MGRPKILLMVPLTLFMKNVPRFPDVGLGWLAAAVKKAGYDIHLLSWNMDISIENLKRYIKENKFDIIGIKVFTKDVSAANKTMRIIRSVSPDTVIVTGGPHPSTSEPEDIVMDFPECDFIFRGEAEEGLPLLVKHICEKANYSSDGLNKIPGLVWKESNIIHSNKPFFSPDLDNFGLPQWDMMEPKDYKTPHLPGGPKRGYSAPIIVTRGCSSICTYCAAYKINGKNVRSRSVASILEEITLLYNKYDVRHIFFLDTRFTHNMERVLEICEGILKNNMDIAWDCVGYENMETLTPDMLKFMKRAGCKFINAGIEAGSDRIRKLINKKGTTKEILEKVKMIKDAGIRMRAFFMIGFPEETKKDIEDAVDYAFSIPADLVQFEIVCPHPGTELFRYLKEKHNIKRINWEDFNVYKSPYPLSVVDSLELYRILKKIRRRYFFLSLRRRFFSNAN